MASEAPSGLATSWLWAVREMMYTKHRGNLPSTESYERLNIIALEMSIRHDSVLRLTTGANTTVRGSGSGHVGGDQLCYGTPFLHTDSIESIGTEAIRRARSSVCYRDAFLLGKPSSVSKGVSRYFRRDQYFGKHRLSSGLGNFPNN